jgi:hypothetical protein
MVERNGVHQFVKLEIPISGLFTFPPSRFSKSSDEQEVEELGEEVHPRRYSWVLRESSTVPRDILTVSTALVVDKDKTARGEKSGEGLSLLADQ